MRSRTGRGLLRGGVYLKGFAHTYEDIISMENLLAAWEEFLPGKKKRTDVQEFQLHLFDNILALHEELKNKTYRHGGYHAFKISDPKPRDIHKATVRDRLLHHAVYRKLYACFDMRFVSDSYSCRIGKGTHPAMNQFRAFARKESKNHTRTVWVLKCDVKKFFANIDQGILLTILPRHIADEDILALLANIISSFNSGKEGIGLPLGNLTSQLLVNVYLNEFDQYVKRRLKAKYYIRYGDDFVILSQDKKWLEDILPQIRNYLWNDLRLTLHPQKVSIATFASGIDFLGWVHFPTHRVLRTTTKRRMLRRIAGLEDKDPTVQSYVGMLSHGNTKKIIKRVKNIINSSRERQ